MKKRQARKIYKRMYEYVPFDEERPYWTGKYELYICGVRKDHRLRAVYKVLKEQIEGDRADFSQSIWAKSGLRDPIIKA